MRKNELVHVLGDFQGCYYVNAIMWGDFQECHYVKQLVQDIVSSQCCGYIFIINFI
jgi:hypothetical protein